MNKRDTMFLIICSALIVGCGSVRPVIDPVADAHKLADGRYEIHLRYSVTTSGGPCLSDSWFTKTTSHETNWLYVKSLEGVQSADQIELRAGVKDNVGDFTYPIQGMRGTVSFTNGTVRIQLDQPHVLRSGAVQGYVPYYLNGTYQVSESSPNNAQPTATALPVSTNK